MEEKKLSMKDYVMETPEYVLRNIGNSTGLTAPLVEEYMKGSYTRILLAACGSSYNGCLCARAFMHHILNIRVDLVSPFTFVNYEDEFDDHDLILVVSQSGRSTNSLEALQLIRSRGHRAIGLTGNPDSPFRGICDLTVDWGVGIEKVGMVTKGVTTLALYLMLFALEAACASGKITVQEKESWKEEMRRTVQAHRELQASAFAFIETHRKQLLSMHNVWVVSARTNLAAAVEAALNPDYTVIFYDSNDDRSHDRILQVYHAVKTVTDRAYLITDQKTDDPDAIRADTHIHQLLNPLAYLAVAPLLAEYVQETKHTDRHPLNEPFRDLIRTKA